MKKHFLRTLFLITTIVEFNSPKEYIEQELAKHINKFVKLAWCAEIHLEVSENSDEIIRGLYRIANNPPDSSKNLANCRSIMKAIDTIKQQTNTLHPTVIAEQVWWLKKTEQNCTEKDIELFLNEQKNATTTLVGSEKLDTITCNSTLKNLIDSNLNKKTIEHTLKVCSKIEIAIRTFHRHLSSPKLTN